MLTMLAGLRATIQQFVNLSPQLNGLMEKERYIMDKLNYKMNSPYRKHKFFRFIKTIRKRVNQFCRPGFVFDYFKLFLQQTSLNENDCVTCPTAVDFEM